MNGEIHPVCTTTTGTYTHMHTHTPYLSTKGEALLLDTSVECWSISVCQGKKYLHTSILNAKTTIFIMSPQFVM